MQIESPVGTLGDHMQNADFLPRTTGLPVNESRAKGTNNSETAKHISETAKSGIENAAKRIAANAVMPRKAKTVSEAQELIKPLAGKPITNKKLGITGAISGNSLGKLGSQSATDKSISPALHAKAVANVDVLFQNAEFDVTHPDEKGVYEVEKIHRLGSLMFDEINSEYVPVMLTVKEFKNPKGNRIYSVEAVDIEAKEKPAGQLVVDRQSPLQQTPITDFTHHDNKEDAINDFNTKVQQLIETAKESGENNSKKDKAARSHTEADAANEWLNDLGEELESPRFQTAENDKKPPKAKEGWGGWELLKKFSYWNATRTDFINERLGVISRDGQLSDLKKIRKSLSEQKGELAKSAQAITDFVKHLLPTTTLNQMSKADIDQILTQIKNASTRTDILANLNKIFDIVIDKQLVVAKTILNKYLKLKVSGKNQSGVNVAKTVDDDTRVMIETAKKHMDKNVQDITKEVVDLSGERDDIISGRNEDEIKDEDEKLRIKQIDNELVGLNIAARYISTVEAAKTDIEGLEKEIKLYQNIREEKDEQTGKVKKYVTLKGKTPAEKKNSHDAIKALKDEIRRRKEEMVQGLDATILDLSGIVRFGKIAKASFDNAVKERRRIIYEKIRKDLGSVKYDVNERDKRTSLGQVLSEFFGSPLHSFAYELRKYGLRAINGEGYLFNHYMPGVVSALQTEWDGKIAAVEKLNAKVEALFGKNQTWEKTRGIRETYMDKPVHFPKNSVKQDKMITNGNGMYIYMLNKMADGIVGLREMGISEAEVDRIAANLPPKLVKLADWMQEKGYTELRAKYNKTHLKTFGIQMANHENYVPIRREDSDITRQRDIGDGAVELLLPSTVTGSLISRVRNRVAIDVLNVDAVDLFIDHINEMEHWNAFVGITQDINTLLSSKAFRNKIEKLHKGNYKTFAETAQIALGIYEPKTAAKGDKQIAMLSSSFAVAKVSARMNTALKQALSVMSFLGEAGDPYFLARLVKNVANPKGSWDWAMENLPLFEKRWKSQMAGNEKLDLNQMYGWLGELAKTTGRVGLIPNAFVDAVVSSIGARSVFESKHAKYIKMGFKEEIAREKALSDATYSLHETQQSSEALFLSTIQMDRTILAIGVSAFNNQSFGSARKMVTSGRHVVKYTAHRGEMIEFRKQQLIDEGLDEANAEKYSKRDVDHSFFKSLAQFTLHAFGNQIVWNVLGSSWILYMLSDDDDEKKKAAKTGLWLSLLTAPIRGFTGGASIEGYVEKLLSGNGYSRSVFGMHPMLQDTEVLAKTLKTLITKGDFTQTVWQLTNYISKIVPITGGIDIGTASNIMAGFYDLISTNRDLTWNQVALDLSLIINAPDSQTKKLAEELKSGDVDAFIKEYTAFRSKYGILYYPLVKDKEPVYGEPYRERFSHLKSALNRKIKELDELDAQNSRWKVGSVPYKRLKNKIGRLEIDFDRKINALKRRKERNKDASPDLDNEINALKTQKAKALIPEVMKLLDDAGVKY
jgi:hypothetical protein